ncbi:MAG: 50S ribosomal protein L1 [Phycisphaerae bacterium]|jgi:large subunit ribosomal protein L1|nr:50S ribosomal protein L1 [Phycisphaerae bacterium]MDP7288922.1 50S ribosomal protein L1 [Phycisphaerae bacterium]
MSRTRSKRYEADMANRPPGPVATAEAVTTVKAFTAGKFDQTIELVMHLGIDPRQADQALRGSIALPNGIGQTRKVVAFCEDADIEKALEAGAAEAGNEDLIKKVQDGWTDFDVAVATPSMMKNVSKLGRVLGPTGKMPSPKAGTVSPDIAATVKEYAAGKVEYRNDDFGNLHVPVGKMSFEADKLTENVDAFIKYMKKIKPASAKGVYMKRVCISGTMTPSVDVDVH